MLSAAGEFDPMSDEDAWAFLLDGTVGRIGLSVSAMPAILPVHYTIVEQTIVVPISPGSVTAAAAAGAVVAFAVDDYERPNSSLRNVLALGTAEVIRDSRAVTVIRIAPQRLIGRSYRS